jgi:SAM-dependent methyltransferase
MFGSPDLPILGKLAALFRRVVAMDGFAVSDLLDWPIFGKSALGAFLRVNEAFLRRLPSRAIGRAPLLHYGEALHAVIRLRRNRTSYFGTFFMRNRPQLELARRLIDREEKVSNFTIAVVASSIGAEVYSITHTLRSCCPEKKFSVNALDISEEAVEFARKGVYPLAGSQFTGENIFARLTKEEMDGFFHSEGPEVRVRSWMGEDIAWRSGDATDPKLAVRLGLQDMVFASNFLCHMSPAEAERCLRGLVRMVRPGGYLFVSGVDLDVRTKVVRDLGLEPVTEMMEEIHEGDSSLRNDWPFRYWGLEPFNRRRSDWQIRYCSVFQVASDNSGAY